MMITSRFDGGNIKILEASKPDAIKLAIRPDHQSDFLQWFYFQIANCRGQRLVCHIINAGDAAYTDGWPEYKTVASYDRHTWFRVETRYDAKNGTLIFELDCAADKVWFAYFAPYSQERYHDLIADISVSPAVSTEVLGYSLDGRPLEMVTLSDNTSGHSDTLGGNDTPDKKHYWLIGRQHPGEAMAAWWMEGAFEKLLDSDDPISKSLLQKAVFHLVPNMNPDGAYRGHLRTNAAGVNLNRVWHNPQMETEPEVALVKAKMIALGCDFHLDVHGDEALPYNFLAGFEGIPNLRQGQLDSFKKYRSLLDDISPDFQQRFGYEEDAPGTADMQKCTDWVANHFGCMAATLEMPFKDNDNLPDSVMGWSPDRCRTLAGACLDALYLWQKD